MKVRLTVEMDIEIDRDEYPNITSEDILKGIRIIDDDGVDGFDILTDIPGYDCTSDFFLKNGVIKEKHLIRNLIEDVDIDKIVEYIVRDGTQCSKDGTWSHSYLEFLYHFGAEIHSNNEICKKLVESLEARKEVDSVALTINEIEVTYHFQYCENLDDELTGDYSKTEWYKVCEAYCKKVGAELLFVNESDFGCEMPNGEFAHIYADELQAILEAEDSTPTYQQNQN